MLYLAGVRFSGTQYPELGKFPDTLLEARAFIERHRTKLAANLRRSEHHRACAIQNEQRRAAKKKLQAQRREVQRRQTLPPAISAEVRIAGNSASTL